MRGGQVRPRVALRTEFREKQNPVALAILRACSSLPSAASLIALAWRDGGSLGGDLRRARAPSPIGLSEILLKLEFLSALALVPGAFDLFVSLRSESVLFSTSFLVVTTWSLVVSSFFLVLV